MYSTNFGVMITITILLPQESYSIEDFFTSLSVMELLIETEEISIERIEKYVREDRKQFNSVKQYLTESEKIFEKAIKMVEVFLGNPINAYRLIRALTDTPILEKVIQNITYYQRNKTVQYPTEKDLIGASKGVIRLQTTYQLNITDLANGTLETSFNQNGQALTEYVTAMTASDCYQLGISHEAFFKDEKIAWMLESYNRLQQSNDSLMVKEEDVIDQLATEYCYKGEFEETLKWSLKGAALISNESRTISQLVNKRLEECLQKGKNSPIDEKNSFKHYTRTLCRDHFTELKSVSGLKCHYKTGPHPVLKLARIKAEQLFRNPDIWMYHEVITDQEIETILQMAKGNVKRVKELDYRIAKAFFLNEENELIEGILRRMSHFTEISVDTTEPVHVMNYGVGGYVDLHYDWFRKNVSDAFFGSKGNRMATVILYLSNVFGGSTVFTPIQLKVNPIRGSALFFRNLNPAGDLDYNIYHLCCPILRGSKWIGTKWIHEVASDVCPVWRIDAKKTMTGDMYSLYTAGH